MDNGKRRKVEYAAPGPPRHLGKGEESLHVFFCLDQSGSMRQRDVETPAGMKTRWEAVFDLASDFIRSQMDTTAEGAPPMAFTLVLWSDEARLVFKRELLRDARTGSAIRQKLQRCSTSERPEGGTYFAAAFRAVSRVLDESRVREKVLLMFLSDGRPADMPAFTETAEMPDVYRRGKVEHKSCCHWIQRLKKQADVCFNFVGIGNPSSTSTGDVAYPWLKRMSHHFGAQFYAPALKEEKDGMPGVKEEKLEHPLRKVKREPASPSTALSRVKTEVKDERYESPADALAAWKPRVKTEVKEERYESPAGWAALQSAGTPARSMSRVKEETLTSTFFSLSQSCTTMRMTGMQRGQLKEVKFESCDDAGMGSTNETCYNVTKMALTAAGDGFRIRREAVRSTVKMRNAPFAKGGSRLVYRMKEVTPGGKVVELVGKEALHEVQIANRLSWHLATQKCHQKAREMATAFNAATASCIARYRALKPDKRVKELPYVDFLEAEVYRLDDASCPGGLRYLAVEKYLGGKYDKFNDNNGRTAAVDVDGDESGGDVGDRYELPQAFSHYSYRHSAGSEIVVDVQGVYVPEDAVGHYTDPQMHSIAREYGDGDLGQEGIDKFFKTHTCGRLCKILGLNKAPATKKASPPPVKKGAMPPPVKKEPTTTTIKEERPAVVTIDDDGDDGDVIVID
eukprot:TRINITY_DN27910_c0_g1_i1.p1 TRINITY_DN27910_c0_g1~~TRINITY_DN27910_c0_g1_i1.p1  ORF type:complete len:802 (+),score=189.34 TRINITY_DN27910_c0_g1_i1:360-2408(+)